MISTPDDRWVQELYIISCIWKCLIFIYFALMLHFSVVNFSVNVISLMYGIFKKVPGRLYLLRLIWKLLQLESWNIQSDRNICLTKYVVIVICLYVCPSNSSCNSASWLRWRQWHPVRSDPSCWSCILVVLPPALLLMNPLFQLLSWPPLQMPLLLSIIAVLRDQMEPSKHQQTKPVLNPATMVWTR